MKKQYGFTGMTIYKIEAQNMKQAIIDIRELITSMRIDGLIKKISVKNDTFTVCEIKNDMPIGKSIRVAI